MLLQLQAVLEVHGVVCHSKERHNTLDEFLYLLTLN